MPFASFARRVITPLPSRHGLLHVQQHRDRRTPRAAKRHGVERVLIVDWDVHHGNGTQDMFYDDGSVCSSSARTRRPWYPGTGAADETGNGAGKRCDDELSVARLAPGARGDRSARSSNRLLPAAEDSTGTGHDFRRLRFARRRSAGRLLLTDADFADADSIVRGVRERTLRTAGWCPCSKAATISAASRFPPPRMSAH